MSKTMKLDAKHYLIVLGCMLLQAIPYGFAQNVPPLFMRPLHETFGFSFANIGLILTVGAVAASLVSPIAGKFFAKHSTKMVMLGGLLVSCAGLFMNAFSTQIWQFFIANGIIQIGCIVFSGLGVPYLIGRWFDKENKAKALGIAFAGGSIGNFFLQPIVSGLLSNHGVSWVYFVTAAFALIVGLLVLFFMIHDRNATVVDADHDNEPDEAPALKGIGSAATRKLPLFWILCSGMFFIGLNISAQSAQYANYFGEVGFSKIDIGTIGSTFAVACLIGNVGGGFLFSHLGVFKSAILAGVIQLTSALMMIALEFTGKNDIIAHLWAALYGLSVFIYMSGPAVIIQDCFGMKESSETLGVYSIFFAVGFAAGNVIFGAIVDNMGFSPAWWMVIGCILVGYSILIIAMKKILKHKYAEVEA